MLGWMNSRFRMTISEATVVAYDPSCVQHQVRMTQGLNKGLVFGVLDVAQREIIWLEMPFWGQVVQQMDAGNIAAFLKKLESKLTIGQLLAIKAEAQRLKPVGHPKADEVYTLAWARNSAAVSRLPGGLTVVFARPGTIHIFLLIKPYVTYYFNHIPARHGPELPAA